MARPRNHDEYIAGAAEFARPILEKLRRAVHKACPDVEETIRWGAPHFDHAGILAGMSAFKQHVNFGFWRGKELEDPEGLFEVVGRTEISSMRIESLADLPPERVLVRYVKEAARLNEALAKAPKEKATKKKGLRKAKKAPTAPPYLLAALKRDKRALATFQAFSPTAKRDYIEWVTEAKREATRAKRVAQAVEWMAEGKPRNWKYMKEWQ